MYLLGLIGMEKPQNVDTLIDHVGKREVLLIVEETATRPSFNNALASLSV